MHYAPVLLSCYRRMSHLVGTVNALKNNVLAAETDLFIASDGPKSGEEESINNIRKYLKQISGFKSVTIFEQPRNIGRVKNVRPQIQQLLEKYKKLIYLEEDIVTAPGFLSFMNQGLSQFYNEDRIVSISGFTMVNQESVYDCFTSGRAEGWGAGLWVHKYKQVIQPLPAWSEVSLDASLLTELNLYGSDLLAHLENECRGLTDAWDVRMCYWSVKRQLLHVIPTKTFVRNSGLDGTGENCPPSTVFDASTLSCEVKFTFLNLAPEVNSKILQENCALFINDVMTRDAGLILPLKIRLKKIWYIFRYLL
jgi:hypothetical protein